MKKYTCPIPNCTYSWLENRKGWLDLYEDHLKLNRVVEEVTKSLKETSEKKIV